MANNTDLLSTTSSILQDVVTANENNMDAFRDELAADIWRYGWPPLCVTGLVGNTLVLLVLRRDGLVRTSANVYLSALAVLDNLVLMVASVSIYPRYSWGYSLSGTSTLACHTVSPAHHTLATASIWIIVAFTADRCVATRSLLINRRMCTASNAGIFCISLLVLSFFKNIDLCFTLALTIYRSGKCVCQVSERYEQYMHGYRPWTNVVLNIAVPLFVVLACNWAIIRQLRRKLIPTAVRDSMTRTTRMCLGVSFAFVVCVVPIYVFFAIERYWPMMSPNRNVIISSLFLLRYVNHAINFVLFCLTGARFRRELVVMFRNCIQRGYTAVAVVRRMPYRVTGRIEFSRGIGDDLEMR